MNPYACRIALRPRAPTESVDLALRMVQTHPGVLLRLAAVVLGPFAVIACVAPVLPLGPEVLLGVVLLLSPVLQTPFTALGARLLFEDRVLLATLVPDASRMASTVLARWGAWLLVGAASVLTCSLALIPLWIRTGFVGEVVLLERQPVVMALSRAGSLASREGGAAVGGGLVLAMLTLWGALAGELLGQLVVSFVFQAGLPFGALWQGEVTPFLGLGLLAVQPLIAWTRLLLYVDLRTRAEGWDLQVRARAVAGA